MKNLTIMKNLIILFFLTLTTLNSSFASNNYQEAMTKALEKLEVAKDAETFQASANQFDRIANAEKDQWEAWYYSAYAHTVLSFMIEKDDSDKRDGFLDKAQEAINKAKELSANNSEILVVQAYIYMGKTSVSPMIRGMMYGPKTGTVLEEALKIEPNNPRGHSLMGQNVYYTPKMFGGGAENAKPHLEKAVALFETAEEGGNCLAPTWGAYYTKVLLKKYEKE